MDPIHGQPGRLHAAQADIEIDIEPGQCRPDRVKVGRPGRQDLARCGERCLDISVEIQVVDL